MKQIEKMPAPRDWHPADIKAALTKAGWSFNQLGNFHGYTSKSSLTQVLRNPWPKAEGIVASALGEKPGAIWPSRYHTDLVTPNRQKGRKPVRPDSVSHTHYENPTTHCAAGNPQSRQPKLTSAPSI